MWRGTTLTAHSVRDDALPRSLLDLHTTSEDLLCKLLNTLTPPFEVEDIIVGMAWCGALLHKPWVECALSAAAALGHAYLTCL